MRLAAHSIRIVYQMQPHKRLILDKMFFVGFKESLTKNHHRRTVYLTSVESSFRVVWSSQIRFRDQSTGKCWKNEKGEKLSILYNSTRTLFVMVKAPSSDFTWYSPLKVTLHGTIRNDGVRPFQNKVVSIQVVSIRTREVILQKNFDHFKYKVCRWTWKTFWVNILRSLSHVRGPIYT